MKRGGGGINDIKGLSIQNGKVNKATKSLIKSIKASWFMVHCLRVMVLIFPK